MTAPVSQQEWEAARRDATAAIPAIVDKVGLPAVLLPYQQRAVGLLDSVGTQVLFIEKSRRIGLTWGLAAYAVLRAGKQKAAGGMDVMYISYSREMTREFIDACAMWARAFSVAAAAEEAFLFDEGDDTGDKAIQAFRIRFASGFEIIALSSAPRGLRGKQGVVIIDEAAFVDSLDTLIEAAMAFLMWGGQVVVCSTHFGTENPFNVYIQDMLAGRKPGHHMRIDLDDALNDGLFERICLVNGDTWTPEGEAVWRQSIIDFYGSSADQELYCVASMGSGTWLTAPLIEARMTSEGKVLTLELPADYLQRDTVSRAALLAPFMEELAQALSELDMKPRYAGGFDFARVADLSVFTLLAIKANLKRREALTVEMRGVPGDEQKAIVRDILECVRDRLVGAAFDATGMGWTVAEDMGRIFGIKEDEDSSGLIWAIKFSQDWYRLHMPPLKTAFEDDMIALIPCDDHVSDLRVIKMVRGIPRVPDTREGAKGLKRHGDFAIGLALAHFASRMRWVEYAYRAAKPASAAPRSDRLNWYPENDDRSSRNPHRSPLGARIRGGI